MGYKSADLQDFVIQKLDYIVYTVILFTGHKDIFTNMELAIMIWGFSILIFCSLKKDISKSINDVIVGFTGVINHYISKVTIAYFLIITIMFSNFKDWEIVHTKEVIWFVLFIYAPMFYNEVNNNQGKTEIIQFLKKQFYLSTIVIYIINLFELILIMDIIFVGLYFLIGMISAIIRDEKLNKILNYAKIIIYLYYFTALICFTDSNFDNINMVVALISYALPIVYTLISIPLIVILGIFTEYDKLFAVLDIRSSKKCKYLLARRLKLIFILRCNKKKIYFFKDNYIIKIYHFLSEKGFNKVLKDFRKEYKNEKHTLIV